MATYENEFSNFPTTKITLHSFKNVDDTIAPVINQINALREKGLYDLAQDAIKENADILSEYVIDATTIRTIEEEIYNTQTYARKIETKSQYVRFDETEPEEIEDGDIWIGGA